MALDAESEQAEASPASGSAGAAEEEVDVEKWRLDVAYDGTDFAGWQRQAAGREGARGIQAELDVALSLVFRAEIRTVGASRTDAGVHARGQACHFEAPRLWGPRRAPGLDATVALRRLRRELPGAILAVALGRVPTEFHARLSATRKRYSYRLATVDAVSPFEARFCWCCGPVDVPAMAAAAATLRGRPLDFSAFAMEGHEPEYHGGVEKTVEIILREDGPDRLLVLVACERFLYRMVRRIVGGLVEVGKGRIPPEQMPVASRKVIPTAPPGGLCLDAVEFPPEFPCVAETIPPPADLAPPPWT